MCDTHKWRLTGTEGITKPCHIPSYQLHYCMVKTAKLSWATASHFGSSVELQCQKDSRIHPRWQKKKKKKESLSSDSHWKMKWSGIQQGAARAKAESNAISQDEQSEESNRDRQTTAQRQRNGHASIRWEWWEGRRFLFREEQAQRMKVRLCRPAEKRWPHSMQSTCSPENWRDGRIEKQRGRAGWQ